jgi:hypothetical protein
MSEPNPINGFYDQENCRRIVGNVGAEAAQKPLGYSPLCSVALFNISPLEAYGLIVDLVVFEPDAHPDPLFVLFLVES